MYGPLSRFAETSSAKYSSMNAEYCRADGVFGQIRVFVREGNSPMEKPCRSLYVKCGYCFRTAGNRDKNESKAVALYGVSMRRSMLGSEDEWEGGFAGGSGVDPAGSRGVGLAGERECVVGGGETEGADVLHVRLSVRGAASAFPAVRVPGDAAWFATWLDGRAISTAGLDGGASWEGFEGARVDSVSSSSADEADRVRGRPCLPRLKGLERAAKTPSTPT